MNFYFFVVLHIIGFSAMAGMTLLELVNYRQFWKLYAVDRQKAATVLAVLAKSAFVYPAGFLLILASGITMVAMSHGAFAQQSWFRIKMTIVLLALINGAVLGSGVVRKIRAGMDQEIAGGMTGSAKSGAMEALRGRHRAILILQVLFFLIIFTLSAYKFN